MVPFTTCRMVAETASRQVPVAVPEQVPVTYNPCRPDGRPPVAVQTCTMVPVAVPQCLTCP